MGTDPAETTLDEQFHRVIAEGSADLHTLITVDGTYRFVSSAIASLFGWQPDQLIGEHESTFTHPDDVRLVEASRRAATRDTSGPVITVARFRCADGSYRWTEAVSCLVAHDDEPLVVSTVRDIGDRKKSELDLQRQATTDPLTGVANRIVFMDHLRQALRRLSRRPGLVAVLFLDLDHFKLVNDSVGHLGGDAVLLEMAERLRHYSRPQDTLARLGGDEFAIVVEDISRAEEAAALAERIIEAGRAEFDVGGEQITCTTSVGVSVTADADREAESLLQEADLALYRAKDRGRDRVEIFDEEMRTRAVGRHGTERMLRRAIDGEQLRVAFQPIVDLRTARTVSAEVLVRVWDPDQGEVLPAERFVEVAEETGLLATMGDWVLQQAIQQLTRWRELLASTDFSGLAINVTARHLADPEFARSVIENLAAHHLTTGALQIEVTERALMEASNSAMTGLNLLRNAGVRVGLDDFGTGYSSLSYLRLFPLDFVKLDRSFICDLDYGTTERAIVGATITLCHALGLRVVAEGVESPMQLEHLVNLGCDSAQGFLLAPPGAPEVIEDRVLHHVSARGRTPASA